MTGEKPKEQPERTKQSGLNLPYLHNHAYFVIGILEMLGLFSVALNYIVKNNSATA
ncbi:hypothetical protein NTG1052_610001 [Candidatus Nitrotoga sp. 1052]|nr:hypothetical protein NTG1052_610001 [Candidatus Nitrotoga sp. 1052]